jgi:phospholipid/cholesterol/gamma-HCH transport system substrate-binding protein
MTEPSQADQPPKMPADLEQIAHLRLKVASLLVAVALLLCGAALYLLHARGAFEVTQRLVLVSDDSEGVVVGMDLTFSGFPIGRVRRIELAPDGNARIMVEVPRKDAHWLRNSSVFTLQRGFLGNTSIRAYSGMLSDPPLPDDSVRPVLRGDATAEIPRMVASVRELVQNVTALTAQDAALSESLANLRELSAKLNGPRGALGALLGNEKDAQKVITAVERANQLLARVDGVAVRADGLAARADVLIGNTDALMAQASRIATKADDQLLGKDGLLADAKATMAQLGSVLAEARASLQRMDALLQDAQAISGNARIASTDLGALRADIDNSLRKVEHLVNEINRKWPFTRDTQVKLP